MLIIQRFCTVGRYNLVDKNYCSTYIPSLVSCQCKIAVKRAFEYKQTFTFTMTSKLGCDDFICNIVYCFNIIIVIQ